MVPELRAALADDCEALIRLHDREMDVSTLAAMQAADFPFCLALPPAGEAGQEAYGNLQAALVAISSPPIAGELNELAADYAAIYLNNSIGASPYESVWLDNDHLACQHSMFELRELYAAAGLEVPNWRQRYDDHLVCQLQYLRHCLLQDEIDWAALATFIDDHLGYWLPDFAQRVTQFGKTDFYAGVAEVTYVWLERLRELLAEIHALPRPAREVLTDRIRRKLALDKAEVAPIKFMPGAQGPSW